MIDNSGYRVSLPPQQMNQIEKSIELAIRKQLINAAHFSDVYAILSEYLIAHDIALTVDTDGFYSVFDGATEIRHVTIGSATQQALDLYKQRIVAAGDDKPQPLQFPEG